MNFFIKTACAVMAFLCFAPAAFAGTTTGEDIFKEASKYYDDVLKQYGKIKGDNEKADEGKKITREQYNELKITIDKAIDLFDQYNRVGSDDASKKAGRYYTLVLKYYVFVFKNDLGEFKDNFNNIGELDGLLSTVNGYYFPIKYGVGGKNYIIEYSHRASVEKNLLVEFVEASTNAGKSIETIKYARRAYNFYQYGDYNLWWCAHLWYYHANKQYYSGNDMLEPAEKVIYAMSGMKRSDIKKIKDSSWVNYTHAYHKINSLLSITPALSRGGEVWAKAGEAFEKLDEDKWALEYYNKALKDGYGDRAFLIKMMDKGRDKKDKDLVKTAADIFDGKNLYYTYGCSDYNMMADYFEYAGDAAKTSDLREKYKTCIKAQNKEQRRRERGAKVFLSFAPLPLLSHNLQGSLQIGGNRRLHEFGLRQVKSQKDKGLDMGESKTPKEMIWNGMAYYYTYKKFVRGSSDKAKTYFGFQFRYTDKKYDAQTRVQVYNANTNAFIGNYTFNPTEKRYDFTLQFGTIIAGKYFHSEFYMGTGIGYSVFNGGSLYWGNGDYKIQNHTFLQNREETRIGLTLHMGYIIGLNLVNK
jgi:hypothetical protein